MRRPNHRFAAPAAVVLFLAGAPASARDLGVRGATWPVAEPDLLAGIEARLSGMERSGELARLGDEARARARRSLEEPEPVPGIVPATRHSARAFDPAVVVTEDIAGPDGETVAAAGTRIDPFEHVSLTADVLFVDGRREAEIAWALARERPAKIVLLAGRPLDLMRRHGRPFYFDLGGRLAKRFAIRATPTVLAPGDVLAHGDRAADRQMPADRGTRLVLTEIPVPDPSGPEETAPACRPQPESTSPTNQRRQPPC